MLSSHIDRRTRRWHSKIYRTGEVLNWRGIQKSQDVVLKLKRMAGNMPWVSLMEIWCLSLVYDLVCRYYANLQPSLTQCCPKWIDCCCIDKTSSAELSEAINSMFKWYENAAVCYAYISDVLEKEAVSLDEKDSSFRNSLWFTRGWTLQELVCDFRNKFFFPF
jgi:hypothetical protein